MKHRATILAGGNVGDTAEVFRRAERLLEERGVAIVARSHTFESEAWGFESEQKFLNYAFEVEVAMGCEALLEKLQEVEELLGRNRAEEQQRKESSGERYASRTIDLDIMFFEEEHIKTERLSVPHPLIMEREFAIVPLCDLMGCTRKALKDKIERIER